MKHSKFFASDNYAGVHPEIMESIIRCNQDHARAYGADTFTEEAICKFQQHFGPDIDVYFVWNGTGANVVSIKTLIRPWQAVVCAQSAHLNTDECGAPEGSTGCKLLAVETPDGKITPKIVQDSLLNLRDQHRVQPKMVSITQSTEYGTVYTLDEIRKIAEIAHKHDLYLHIDGARLCNAAASLNCSLRDTSFAAGADVISFGGTKNGMMYGEAIVFANKKIAQETKFVRKQATQLASKMRFIAAQFIAMLSNELWLRNASHSNLMAFILEREVRKIDQVQITQKVQANSIFAIIPTDVIPILQDEFPFYTWDEKKSEVRWMCSFDTTEEDIKAFVGFIKETLSKRARK